MSATVAAVAIMLALAVVCLVAAVCNPSTMPRRRTHPLDAEIADLFAFEDHVETAMGVIA